MLIMGGAALLNLVQTWCKEWIWRVWRRTGKKETNGYLHTGRKIMLWNLYTKEIIKNYTKFICANICVHYCKCLPRPSQPPVGSSAYVWRARWRPNLRVSTSGWGSGRCWRLTIRKGHSWFSLSASRIRCGWTKSVSAQSQLETYSKWKN